MESCFTNPTSRCNAAQPRPRRPRCQPFSFTINGTNFDPATVQVLFVGGGCTPCTFSNQFAYHQCRRDLGGSGDIELLPAHLRDWLMHQPKSLDCDSDGLLTDRGPKPSGNSCLLPNGTGVYWAILSGTAWHSTFGLKSRSLHEPLPVHVTTQTNPKRECRAHVR